MVSVEPYLNRNTIQVDGEMGNIKVYKMFTLLCKLLPLLDNAI